VTELNGYDPSSLDRFTYLAVRIRIVERLIHSDAPEIILATRRAALEEVPDRDPFPAEGSVAIAATRARLLQLALSNLTREDRHRAEEEIAAWLARNRQYLERLAAMRRELAMLQCEVEAPRPNKSGR
jgi:hypothetical protein